MVSNEDLAKIEALIERAEIEAAGFTVLKHELDAMRDAVDALEAAIKRVGSDTWAERADAAWASQPQEEASK